MPYLFHLLEDEVHARALFHHMMKQCGSSETNIILSKSIEEAHYNASRYAFHAEFLDISLPDGSAFDYLTQQGRIQHPIVFITGHDDFMLEAIRLGAMDYLLKPLGQQDFQVCLDRVMAMVNQQNLKTRLAINSLEGIEFLNLTDIVYCRADNNYAHIRLQNGRELCISKTLKWLENTIASSEFVRIHQSYLVNKAFVHRYIHSDQSILLYDGKMLPVSRAKRAQALTILAQ
ncbi:MAG: LytTR family DNA-binding domain-containing protein [Bacteroidota bacterium]|nr:LytTR family DNA-binding domain-containing protein [Bacteroidota bacterium]